MAAVERPPLDRRVIRQRAALRFDVEPMIARYVEVYRAVAGVHSRD